VSDERDLREITDSLEELDRLVHARHHRLAQKYNLTEEQYSLLIELDELCLDVADGEAAPTIGQMAEVFRNAQNTMSDRISRLERRGLVQRVPDPEDRRVSRVVVTAAGQQLLDTIRQEAGRDFLLDALGRMPGGTVAGLRTGLSELLVRLREERD